MDELTSQLNQLANNIAEIRQKLDIDEKKKQISNLQHMSAQADFWQDDTKARATMQELSSLEEDVNQIEELDDKTRQLLEFLAITDNDEFDIIRSDVETQIKQLQIQMEQSELRLFLSGEYDSGNAIISIHSGQGGTEAMDWADMLLRMYLRYVEKNNWKYQLIDKSYGEEAGIKSASILVQGKLAYGYLKNEAGTHRLVRQSPFNADNLRQTSFALVEILPELDQNADIEVRDEDMEWTFSRSSGKGGQNVNKVNTAARLKHLPSGITIEAQAHRTQVQNRALALTLLKAKLWEKQKRAENEKLSKLKGQHHPATFGSQIRSYVLHPYHLVKDNRTQVETTDTSAVLDGDLDIFISAEIKLN